ncbi:hypothetical protein [Mariniphaga sediminis]|uniref:hypothetical protein n=1 Tax=Mariniphaga sediminis TaxID=1628158 RepID=UPI0035614892
MVNQYPDTVIVAKEPEYMQGEKGYFSTGAEPITFDSECRAEPAGSNPVIRGDDGNDILYSWLVYLPKSSQVFAFGDKVKLTKADGSIYESSLKRFYNGQFNTRLWV